MAEHEERIASSKSSPSDAKFDMTIGYIEDIIMEEEFQKLQNDFMEKHYHEFEDNEENKLCYTDIHKSYTDLIERYLCVQLTKLLPEFSTEEFQKQLITRKNELEGEIFEILVTFSDFLAFKEMMVDYKAEKEGRSIDLSSGFTVTSLAGSTNGLRVGPVSLGISGTSATNRVNLMTPDDMQMDDNGSPRLDCGEPMHESGSSESNGSKSQQTDDVSMESPR